MGGGKKSGNEDDGRTASHRIHTNVMEAYKSVVMCVCSID